MRPEELRALSPDDDVSSYDLRLLSARDGWLAVRTDSTIYPSHSASRARSGRSDAWPQAGASSSSSETEPPPSVSVNSMTSFWVSGSTSTST